jgi:hypothetical protein
VSYQDQTKADLQEELRRRELPVSGSKGELVERLDEDDQEVADELGRSELADRLRARGDAVSGSKSELRERLLGGGDEDEEGEEEDEPDAEEAEDETDVEDEVDEETEEAEADDEAAEAEDEPEADDTRADGDGDERSSSDQAPARRPPRRPLQLARAAARQLEQLSGRRVDGTSGLEQTAEGWRIVLELVEASRIPPSTDVIGTYEVIVDDDGHLLRYERLRRYIRGQAGEDQ